jgi:hypothetical protein
MFPTVENLGTIAPFAVNRVAERHTMWVARVPGVFRAADLQDGRFSRERRKWVSGFWHFRVSS